MPTVHLPHDAEILLDKLARHRGVSREEVLGSFVEAWVEDLEDHVWAIMPPEPDEEGEAIPLEEVIRELELADRSRASGEEAA